MSATDILDAIKERAARILRDAEEACTHQHCVTHTKVSTPTLAEDNALLVAALRAVLAMHTPVPWQEENEEGGFHEPGTGHDLPPFCHACTHLDYVVAVESGEAIDVASDVVYWPCADVLAIEEVLDR